MHCRTRPFAVALHAQAISLACLFQRRLTSALASQAKQEVGQFMVLNAGAYHCGYNQGYNCAEAVNFAVEARAYPSHQKEFSPSYTKTV